MPIKYHTDSYRNRKGLNYRSIGDYENKALAMRAAKTIRKEALKKAFVYKLNDGCYRVFVENGSTVRFKI